MFEIAPAVGTNGYQIPKSLRFNSADSASLTRTFTTGNRKTWTWSAWVKRSSLGAIQVLFCSAQTSSNNDAVYFLVYFNSDDTLALGGATTTWRTTTQVFRDPAAHYHITIAVDTTQATAGDRIKLYVNGVQVTAFSTTNNPAQNADLGVNIAQQHSIGARPQLTPNYHCNGYISEVNFVGGQALTADSFGKLDPVTSQWVPKKYTGSYGTNGFYLPFNDGTSTTTLGYDRSGNGNNWTLNNLSVASGVGNDWLSDTPTNNYCVLNPLAKTATVPTISEGALKASGTDAGAVGSLPMYTGKWYAECVYATAKAGDNIVGVHSVKAFESSSSITPLRVAGSVGYDSIGGATSKVVDNSFSAYGSSWTTGDVIGVALDIDNGEITFFKNGVSQGAIAYSFAAGPWVFANGYGNTAATIAFSWNFGQRPFAYTPPDGFKSLCTKNLPAPTIKKPSKHFDVKTYTGNGTTNSVTGLNFQPDLLWVKARNAAAAACIVDSVRGLGAGDSYQALAPNETTGEYTAESTQVTSLVYGGFTLGDNTDATFYVNRAADSYVAWNWEKSPTSGFDIVTYAGTGSARTIAHALGVAPSMVIIKNRSASYNWPVWSSSFTTPTQNYFFLNATNAVQTHATAYWNGSLHTSSTLSIGTSADVNANGNNFIAYVFAEVPGFSKFGKYTGNGNADGPFVYCGFKPKYVMVKRSDGAGNWVVMDSARSAYNIAAARLWANLPNAESTANPWIDFVSNGLKVRDTSSDTNASGGTYIFMAFAEAPMKYSRAR